MTEVLIQSNPLAWRIRARFAGHIPPREYVTPDIRHFDPGWGNEIFNRQIESLEFFLPTGHKILLAGMEQFNFFVEASQSLSGKSDIIAAWLCGKVPCSSLVEMWRVGNGKVVRNRVPWGKEWGGGPTRGWRPGSLQVHTMSTITTIN